MNSTWIAAWHKQQHYLRSWGGKKKKEKRIQGPATGPSISEGLHGFAHTKGTITFCLDPGTKVLHAGMWQRTKRKANSKNSGDSCWIPHARRAQRQSELMWVPTTRTVLQVTAEGCYSTLHSGTRLPLCFWESRIGGQGRGQSSIPGIKYMKLSQKEGYQFLRKKRDWRQDDRKESVKIIARDWALLGHE